MTIFKNKFKYSLLATALLAPVIALLKGLTDPVVGTPGGEKALAIRA